MSTIRVNAIQNTNANSGNMLLHANGNVSMTTSNTTLFIGNTAISNAGISVGGAAINPLATGMRNRIINGDMRIDQRWAGTANTPLVDNSIFITDRFCARTTQASKLTYQQVTDAPAGFSRSLRITVAATATVGSSDHFGVDTRLEGHNVSDLSYGSSDAKTTTLSFWVKSSTSGTFGATLFYFFYGYPSFPFTYSINSANTWEYKTVVIPGYTGQALDSTTNAGAFVIQWCVGVGSTLSASSGGSWYPSTLYRSVTGATNIMGTVGATFQITGIQLEAGTVATPFEFRQFGQELALCQRYYWRNNASATYTFARQPCVVVMGSTTGGSMVIINPVPMRAVPVSVDFNALALYDGANLVAISNLGLDQSSTLAASMSITVTGATVFRNYIVMGNSSASSYLGISAEL